MYDTKITSNYALSSKNRFLPNNDGFIPNWNLYHL